MNKAAKPAVTLRRSLRVRVALLVSGAVLLFSFGIFLFGYRPMVEHIAEGQFALTATKVEVALDRVFEPAEQVLTISRGWLGKEPPDTRNPEAFNRLFQGRIEALSGHGKFCICDLDGSLRQRGFVETGGILNQSGIPALLHIVQDRAHLVGHAVDRFLRPPQNARTRGWFKSIPSKEIGHF